MSCGIADVQIRKNGRCCWRFQTWTVECEAAEVNIVAERHLSGTLGRDSTICEGRIIQRVEIQTVDETSCCSVLKLLVVQLLRFVKADAFLRRQSRGHVRVLLLLIVPPAVLLANHEEELAILYHFIEMNLVILAVREVGGFVCFVECHKHLETF